jgi:hypothetical protein
VVGEPGGLADGVTMVSEVAGLRAGEGVGGRARVSTRGASALLPATEVREADLGWAQASARVRAREHARCEAVRGVGASGAVRRGARTSVSCPDGGRPVALGESLMRPFLNYCVEAIYVAEIEFLTRSTTSAHSALSAYLRIIVTLVSYCILTS